MTNLVNCWKALRALNPTAQLEMVNANGEKFKDWVISSRASKPKGMMKVQRLGVSRTLKRVEVPSPYIRVKI